MKEDIGYRITDIVKDSSFFRKYGYKGRWTSGCQTTVYPISHWVESRKIVIQLDSRTAVNWWKRALGRLAGEIASSLGRGSVTDYYIDRKDGSCPPVAVITY